MRQLIIYNNPNHWRYLFLVNTDYVGCNVRTWLYPENLKSINWVSARVVLLLSTINVSGNIGKLLRGAGR